MLAPVQRQADVQLPGVFEHGKMPIALVGLITLGLLLWFRGPLCPDVSGQFWHAHSMRHGARLYRDLVEINPPLWFWMAMPIDWLAEMIGSRSEPITIVTVGLAVTAAIGATGRVMGAGQPRGRIAFLAYIAVILLIMPARQLEQREHLALIAAIPYLALAGARRRGDRPTLGLALGIGVAAGLGLSLKPYFLLVPMFIEAWLLVSLRTKWRPFRAEALGLGATVAVYVAAILLFTPGYYQSIVPMLLVGYNGVGPTLWSTLGILPLIWLCTLTGTLSQWRSSRVSAAPITSAMLIGALAFAVGWAIQHKGWLYHGIPTTGCCAIALAAVLVETGAAANRFVRLFAPALLIWPLSFALVDVENKITPANDIAPALEGLTRGDPFGLIGTAGATTWPSAIGRGLRNSSRYGEYWMINAVDQRPRDLAAQALMSRVIRDTALDYSCLPPKVIIFLDFKDTNEGPSKSNRLLYSAHPYPLFARDPAFAAVLRHYRPWRSGPVYNSWRQISPLDPVDPALCRRPG